MASRWAFMVYMAGNNSLSDAAGVDLAELRKVGSSEDVKVLGFVKQSGTNSAQRFVVNKAGANEKVEDLGNVDSGSPQTVIDFFRWGVDNAPADKYCLVLWNHGGGWAPDDFDQIYTPVRMVERNLRAELNGLAKRSVARAVFSTTVGKVLNQPTAVERMICVDDGSGHSLDTIEVGNVLKAAAAKTGRPIDVFGMDACLMSGLEVASQVTKSCLVVAGSELVEPGAGWSYEALLRALAAKPRMDGVELGKAIVSSYIDSYRNSHQEWPVTQSAIRTGGLSGLSTAIDSLATALKRTVRTQWAAVFSAHTRISEVYAHTDLYDLREFCLNLRKSIADVRVKAAANDVIKALKPNGCVIAQGHLGAQVTNTGGVSVYLPRPGQSISKYYSDLEFAKQHGWDDFLSAYHAAAKRA